MAVQRVDPLQGFNFTLEMDSPDFGFKDISFRKVSGLDSDIEVIEFRESNKSIVDLKIPGRTKFGNITLEKGMTDEQTGGALYKWHIQISNIDQSASISALIATTTSPLASTVSLDFRKDLTLTIYDRYFATPKRRIKIKQAWPAKLTLGDFDAESGDVVVETLELAHEGWYYI